MKSKDVSRQKTVEEIRSEIAKLTGELAALEGTAIHIWDGTAGDLQDAPPGGALLHVSWAVSDHSYTMWYPTLEGAKAALLRLARENGCVPNKSGIHVDLTSPGCHSSSATIERRAASVVANAPESDLDWSRTLPLHLGGDGLILVSRRDLAELPYHETCVLLQRDVEGDVTAPDGRSFRHYATGSLYSFCELLLRIPPPWSWCPLPGDDVISA